MEKSQVYPRHLGFIVDGNRRWAREQNLPTLNGHKMGLKKVEMVIEELAGTGVQYASFYLFSTENWNRSKDEVAYLMKLAEVEIIKLARKMAKNNIRCKIMGSRERVNSSLLAKLQECEGITKDSTGMTVCICFNYGGRQEIADAANFLLAHPEECEEPGRIAVEDLTRHLYVPEVPDCDMIVRTSGEERISGFMLWRAAYAEFMFMDKYFPALEPDDIKEILKEFASRQRRFGK